MRFFNHSLNAPETSPADHSNKKSARGGIADLHSLNW